jgi:hypothetical protein
MQTSSIVALATMDGRVYGYELYSELLRIQQSGLEIGRVYLAADSFWLED